MSNELDKCIDNLKNGLEIGKIVEVKSPHGQYCGDMEWRLLVFLLRMPDMMPVIRAIIPKPGYFKEGSGQTLHRLIYHAMLDLWDKGEPINLTTLYGKCEAFRQDKPLSEGYSRGDLFELDFQAMPQGDLSDSFRIEAQHIAERIKKRYLEIRAR